jgi:hypothetical protein
MYEQLRLDASNAGRLLKSADGMLEQLNFNFLAAIMRRAGIFDVQIADNPLRAFIDKKAVAMDATALDGAEAWKDARVGVAKNHVRGCAVVPVERAPPNGNFLLNDGAEVVGCEVA